MRKTKAKITTVKIRPPKRTNQPCSSGPSSKTIPANETWPYWALHLSYMRLIWLSNLYVHLVRVNNQESLQNKKKKKMEQKSKWSMYVEFLQPSYIKLFHPVLQKWLIKTFTNHLYLLCDDSIQSNVRWITFCFLFFLFPLRQQTMHMGLSNQI